MASYNQEVCTCGADFPAVFFHTSHWCLSWNTNWQTLSWVGQSTSTCGAKELGNIIHKKSALGLITITENCQAWLLSELYLSFDELLTSHLNLAPADWNFEKITKESKWENYNYHVEWWVVKCETWLNSGRRPLLRKFRPRSAITSPGTHPAPTHISSYPTQ